MSNPEFTEKEVTPSIEWDKNLPIISTASKKLKAVTETTMAAYYDPINVQPMLEEVLEKNNEPQKIRLLIPKYLMSGIGWIYEVQEFMGRVWLSDVKIEGLQEGEAPSAQITITPTKGGDT